MNIRLFGFREKIRLTERKRGPKIVLTQSCIAAVHDCLLPEIHKDHEGIVYLFGQSDGSSTLAIAAIRPEAVTTQGSFSVSKLAMARVVRKAADNGLQVVGQVHTHPGEAYHSDGDEEGARIAYSGYVSIVIPMYGRYLPALEGIAAFMFDSIKGFVPFDPGRIVILSARIQ